MTTQESPTDELCRLLEERDIVWYRRGGMVEWSHDGIDYTATVSGPRSGQGSTEVILRAKVTPAQAIAATVGPKITGDTSDGYHTFNELYHHRAMLFSVIVHDHQEIAWKSKKHHDGSMYDGMFIVGLNTPWGQATYHYDIVPYWNQFDCKELDSAPEWDGHTPDEAIARIGALALLDAATVGAGTCQNVSADVEEFTCSKCGFRCNITSWESLFDGDEGRHRHHHHGVPNHCPNCGRRVVERGGA